MMGGDSVADSSDSFDEFLYRAYESGVGEPEYEADLAEAEAIRPELVTSVLAQARRESPRILAERIVAAGDQAGWSAEDLAYEAVDGEGRSAVPVRGRRPETVVSAWPCSSAVDRRTSRLNGASCSRKRSPATSWALAVSRPVWCGAGPAVWPVTSALMPWLAAVKQSVTRSRSGVWLANTSKRWLRRG